jgi:hypothetical protein
MNEYPYGSGNKISVFIWALLMDHRGVFFTGESLGK